jgi:hypothetical protein
MAQYHTKTLTKALTQSLQTFGRLTVRRRLAYSNFALRVLVLQKQHIILTGQ